MAHRQTNRGGPPIQYRYDLTLCDSIHHDHEGPYEHHRYTSEQQMADEAIRLLRAISRRLDAKTDAFIEAQRPRVADTERETIARRYALTSPTLPAHAGRSEYAYKTDGGNSLPIR